MSVDLAQFGGRRLMQAAPDGGEAWHFGYYPTPAYFEEYHTAPSVHATAPNLVGRWDGKTSISHWDATKLVRGYWPFGEYLPAQKQPRGTCHPAGVPILMVDGTEKPIEKVVVGDIVRTHKGRNCRVVEIMSRVYSGKMVGLSVSGVEGVLIATADHQLAVYDNKNLVWRRIDECTNQTMVFVERFDGVDILPIKGSRVREEENVLVYCFEVEGDHSFYANRIAVKNCVARGGTAALNIRQAIQIAILGSNEEFKPASHSALYGEVRELAGIRGYSDGAMGADAAKALAKFGGKHQEECGERVGREGYYSDDLAVKWGAGSGGIWTPDNIKRLGSDNLALDVRPIRSAEEAADVIASLGVVTVASDQGFTMTRNSDGICSPRGQWMHQLYFASIIAFPDGRKVFGCGQSWGDNTPDGPLLWHCPNYVFGVEWSVADRMLRQGDSMSILAFNGWDNPNPPVIPWADQYI